MSDQTQIKLSETHGGRIILHLAGLLKDHHFTWHLKGILRELR